MNGTDVILICVLCAGIGWWVAAMLSKRKP